jgi:hypothetical protein
MRFLLGLLSLLALTLAPLTAPAQAMTGNVKQAHCADMASQSDHHPAKPQKPDDARCCAAVPAALPAPASASSATSPRDEMTGPGTVPQLAGLQSEAEDPPPRS